MVFRRVVFGSDSDYEGNRGVSEIGACHVYRADPATGELRIVVDDIERPNGLAFSADESLLYVADTRRRHLRVFDVGADATLTGGAVLAECDTGSLDGVRLDDQGRIWAAAGACTASRRTARCSASCWCPRSSRTSRSAGRSATTCSCARPARCTPSASTSAAPRGPSRARCRR